MPRHPNKKIEAALKYAQSKGWTVVESARGHYWGMLRCGHGDGGCQKAVWSMPKSPQGHAMAIRRFVDKCPHQTEADENI